jgi:membrane protein implicated in regulation of membrane protease activity
MFELIGSITPSQFLIIVLLILSLAVIIGDSEITPWVAASIIIVSGVDFIGGSPLIQLISFSVSFFFFIFYARKILYKNQNENNITENIDSMLNQKIVVKKINQDDSSSGVGLSSSGKMWNIRCELGCSISLNSEYECFKIEGLTLVVK